MRYDEAVKTDPFLEGYMEKFFREKSKRPQYNERVSRDLSGLKFVNIIYPTAEHIYAHVFKEGGGEKGRYFVIEPPLEKKEQEKYKKVFDLIMENAPRVEAPKTNEDMEPLLLKLYDMSISIGRQKLAETGIRKVILTKEEYEKFKYFLKRDINGSGAIQPLLSDPWIEDINAIGMGDVFLVHKIFDTLETNVNFDDERALHKFVRNMSERIGRAASVGRPIVDGALPDGSRINIIYADDVSLRGPSFTIRKFSTVPTSITQLIAFGSVSPQIVAYLWLALEYGMNVFVSGETASGKTTILNALLPFVNPYAKILTAEDTPEVLPPHRVWQRLLTREVGPEESRVDMFGILKAALHSRPNYIIVGEIRGKEGSVAFQAMQTGHSLMATFHASSVKKLIQRLVGDPINIPATFMDNLNIAMILQAVYVKGRFLRRCISVEEIEGLSEEVQGVITRQVFEWDPVIDQFRFTGMNNSYILEEKIATKIGYEDKRKIYDDLEWRTKIIAKMVQLKIFDYFEVVDIIKKYYASGDAGLPFRI